MVSITLSVPKELKRDMDDFEDINWSAVAREAIKKRVLLLKQFKQFTKESTFTEEDALRLGRETDRKVSRRLMAKRNN